MRRIVLMVFGVITTFSLLAQTPIKKSNIKVLYVGQNPDRHDGYTFGGNLEVWNEIKKERAKVFHEFFQEYFHEVTLVYGEDYKESMSDSHDVTVFDALPPRMDGTEGEYLQLFPKGPDFVSEDYDAATVLIAGVGGAITWNKKIKIDWLCNCLDSDAFSIDEEHTIFNAPYKVSMEKQMRKLAGGVYSYYSGRDLPDSIPMLRMQEVDHLEGYPPGIVSNPGFGDSPDAEVISGGPSIKSFKAVALGRNGNFFQWGYRADPRHLTEAGKLALINTIHYMKDFKGQKPFINRTNSHRLVALDEVFKASDVGYEKELKLFTRLHNDYNSARARELAGKPNQWDEFALQRETTFPDRAAHLKNVPKPVLEKYLDDWNAYENYYEDNIGYLSLSELKEGPYGHKYQDIIIDQEIQQLGIANNDLALLDKCVAMLESNDQPDLAQNILTRYTTEEFSTAKEWNRWLKKNRDKLFFTERGGYKWMIDQTK